MAEKTPKNDDSAAVRHETRDINARAVVWFGAGLVMIFVVIFISLRWLLAVFNEPHPTGVADGRLGEAPRLPPEPRLQVNPASDMEHFRTRENAILNSYGWIDRRADIVRIPIERAMDLVAQNGLPTPHASSGKTPLQMRQEKANPDKKTP
jgi:hypothetical protein